MPPRPPSISNYIQPSDPEKGRLFPIWVMNKFKEFILDPIEVDPDVDPCHSKKEGRKQEVRVFQRFVASYLDYNSPFRNLLVYHGVGSGKTITALNLIRVLFSYNSEWNVFVILPAALKNTAWIKNLEVWLGDNASEIIPHIHFISSNSPTADKDFLEVLKRVDTSRKALYILDEAHNFFSNYRSNLKSRKGKRALTIYDYIMNEQLENDRTRIICMSATPMRSEPFELALMFNLLRPGSFPTEENVFNDMFLQSDKYRVLNPSMKRIFMQRILGLVSFYEPVQPGTYAKKKEYRVPVKMGGHQDEVYSFYENLERKLERMNAKLYKTYTRQASNFAFPVDAFKRPRPSFAVENQAEYEEACATMIAATHARFASMDKKPLKKDIDRMLKDFREDVVGFLESAAHEKSELFQELYNCSAKMATAVLLALACPGKVILYSNFVKMEGLEVMKIYLEMMGVGGYVEFHGGIDMEQRAKNLVAFNGHDNIHGEKIKVVLLSSAGAEGISLMNVRRVVILEPSWDEELIKQIVGRGIRQCSHRDLPQEERVVEVFRLSSLKADSSPSVDAYIERLALEKQTLKDSFLDAVRSAAVDCEFFKNNNMYYSKYDCFRFPLNQVMRPIPGPSYRKDMSKDFQMERHMQPVVKKVRAKIIEAVMEGEAVSKRAKYLLDEETGNVFDYDLEYPVGKVGRNTKGFFNMMDVNTYVIESRIEV